MFIKTLYILQEGKASSIMDEISIENIVVTTQLADSFNLKKLDELIPDAKYDTEEFPGLVIHFDKPKTAVLIFSSGKIIITGCKNIDSVDKSMKNLINKLKSVGVSIYEKPDVKMQNIVASSDLKKELDLSSIAKRLIITNVEYEPEHFPGLVYRMDDFDAIILLFNSGKMVCTGANQIDKASNAIETMKYNLSSLGVL